MSQAGSACSRELLMESRSVQVVMVVGVGIEASLKKAEPGDSGELSRVFLRSLDAAVTGETEPGGAVFERLTGLGLCTAVEGPEAVIPSTSTFLPSTLIDRELVRCGDVKLRCGTAGV